MDNFSGTPTALSLRCRQNAGSLDRKPDTIVRRNISGFGPHYNIASDCCWEYILDAGASPSSGGRRKHRIWGRTNI